MTRLDRYILSQLTTMFGFFAFVLVGVFWVNRAVSLFDDLIADGQSALVFLEFSALALPNIMRITLAIAAFAAGIAVAMRLSGDSELAVARATGISPWRLSRAAFAFALIVGILMSLITHILVPASFRILEKRTTELSQSLTSSFLKERRFIFPAEGISFFIGEVDAEGRLNDVFITDTTNPGQEITYTAETAYLIRGDDHPSLVMLNGRAQIYRERDRQLAITNFSDFTYDLGQLIPEQTATRRSQRNMSTPFLIRDPEEAARLAERGPARISDELHRRFSEPLLSMAAAVIGFVCILAAPFQRTGNSTYIGYAILAVIIVKLIEGAVASMLQQDVTYWPFAYLPGLTGFGFCALALFMAARNYRYKAPRNGRDIEAQP